MSCDAIAATAMFMLTTFAPVDGAGLRPTLVANSIPAALSPLIREPLYADIVGRARSLKAQAEAYRKAASGQAVAALPAFDDFKGRVAALSDLDMKGHMDLAARGRDGDLKCILKGISQDLPKKLAEVASAATPTSRETALRDLSYLLNDNVEVITAPPAPPV